VVAAVVLVPMLFTAIALLPELTVAVPSNNDDATHFLLIQRASDALANGENVLDHWVPQLELGFPWFIYYQPLPALVVVFLHRALFGLVDLLTVFNVVRYVLLVGLPLTVFWSLRRMGVAAAGAAMAAAASPLLSGDFRYGFDYDSYIWRGFGMYTQLAAMHLSFVTVAIAWSSLRSKKRSGIVWLALALAALVLTHLIYAYMMAITLGVIALVGAESRADIPRRLARLALAGVPAALLSAWLWLPFIAQPAFLGASPYLQTEKYDSYGAAAIVGWLVTGDLMDHGRLPVITALVALGVAAAVVLRRTSLARTALAIGVGTYRHPFPADGLRSALTPLAVSGPPALADSTLAAAVQARPGWATLYELRANAQLRGLRCEDAATQFLVLLQFGIEVADAPQRLQRCRQGETG